jgi:hypothetical protein
LATSFSVKARLVQKYTKSSALREIGGG